MIFCYSSKTCSLIHLTRSLRKLVTSAGGNPEGRIGERLGQREGSEGGTTHSWGPPFWPPCIHTQSTLYRGPNTTQTPSKRHPAAVAWPSCLWAPWQCDWVCPQHRVGKKEWRASPGFCPKRSSSPKGQAGQGGASLELYCFQVWFSQFSTATLHGCTAMSAPRGLNLPVIKPTHFSHRESSGMRWACRLPTLPGTISDLPQNRWASGDCCLTPSPSNTLPLYLQGLSRRGAQ